MALPTILDEIDRLFEELVRRPWGKHAQLSAPSMRTVDDGWIIEVPTQGLRPQDLRIEVQGRHLVITGRLRRRDEQHHGRGWGRTEEEVALHRFIVLPDGADPATIQSTVGEGKLLLHVRHRRPKEGRPS